MKDILGKLSELEASGPKNTGKKMLSEDSTKPPMNAETSPSRLKDVFETLAAGQKPIPVVGKQGGTQQTGAGFLNINDTSPAGQAMQKALADLAAQGKAQIVMPAQAGQTATQPGQAATAAGNPNPNQLQSTQQVKEKDEGKPGKNFAKIAKKAGAKYGSKEAGERVAGAVRAKLAKQGKLEEEQLDELSSDTLNSYLKKAYDEYDDYQSPRPIPANRPTERHFDIRRRIPSMELALKKINDRKPLPEKIKDKAAGMLARIKETGIVKNPDLELIRFLEDWGASAGLAALSVGFGVLASLSEGAKVDRMVKHIEKSERKLGKSKGEAEDIAWATANKRGMLDNKNKKKKTNESAETEYRVLGQYDKKTSKGYDTRPVSVKVKAASEKEAKERAKEQLAHNHKNYKATRVEALTKDVKEADIPSSAGIDTRGAGLGAGRSATTLEAKKAKPDYIDLDKDGNKKESMKKAASDKKKVKEAFDTGRNWQSIAQQILTKVGTGPAQWTDINSFEEFLNSNCDKNTVNAYHGLSINDQDSVYRSIGNKLNMKKTVKESAMNRIQAARLEGKSHGLRGHSYSGKNYDDMGESRAYHEGFKEGLDECYGMSSSAPRATVSGMANQALSEGEYSDAGYELEQIASQINDLAYEAMSLVRGTPEEARARSYWYPHIVGAISSENEYMGGSMVTMMDSAQALMDEEGGEMDEGNAFTGALAKTPRGGTFRVGGNTYTDTATIEEMDYAFEAWDKELSNLLNEGMTVSISKGQQGAPDSVSITAQDADAEQLLSFVKNAGLGIFGDDNAMSDEPRGFSLQAAGGEEPAGIDVVDDNEDMLAIMQKLGGVEASGSEDYADEEGDDGAADIMSMFGSEESEEEACGDCGEVGCGCGSDEQVDEEETEDQMEFEVSENAPDSGEAESTADEDAEAEEDKALAGADSDNEEEINEWANEAGRDGTDASFQRDIDFMTKVISGGLNKQKSTGQTTAPVIADQENRMGVTESISDWAKLAGIKK